MSANITELHIDTSSRTSILASPNLESISVFFWAERRLLLGVKSSTFLPRCSKELTVSALYSAEAVPVVPENTMSIFFSETSNRAVVVFPEPGGP